MNFNKLTDNQVQDFLALNAVDISDTLTTPTKRYTPDGVIIWTYPPTIREKASELFNQLRSLNATTFTVPVIDLYIATELRSKVVPTQRYNINDIMRIDLSGFATAFNIPMDYNTRERVIRILNFMELLDSVTIEDLINTLESSTLKYEILTDRVVDPEPTIDSLYRHTLDRFEDYGYDTNSFEIFTENNKQFLTLTAKLNDGHSFEEEHLKLPATRENMLNSFPRISSVNGKLTIPFQFHYEIAYGEDYEEVIFKLDQIIPNNEIVANYFEII
jgi:hypothetical protein